MGVYGLTSYLREKRRLLSTTTVVSESTPLQHPIVVDGWSFIYDLYNLPWVYGGEYGEFEKLITTVVEAWVRVGLQIYFVFDGPLPDIKFPTVVSRLNQSHIQPSQLFFRTSSASRSTGRFLNETRILPPLAYTTCIQTLEELGKKTGKVELHFADEEGDPFAVELAARLDGYVIGNDSDFVIFNAEGYRGYIPLEEMVWQRSAVAEPAATNDEDDFQVVKKSKVKRKLSTLDSQVAGLLPPGNEEPLLLSLTVYSPHVLASHLKIPTTLLPLFGALVGNDYSKESELNNRKIQSLFFERNTTSAQRITKVADAIQSVVSPGANKRKTNHQVGSVLDLIDKTVNALLIRWVNTPGTREIEEIVEKIVNATLQYAIPKYAGNISERGKLWATGICALHDPEACAFLPMISCNVLRQTEESSQPNPRLLEAREQYLDAYRSGSFSPKLMDILSTVSYWPRIFLENPDVETVGRSIGGPIRTWIYSILDDALGISSWEDEQPSVVSEGKDQQSDSDEDELIDVVESDSEDDSKDFLAPLKGELSRLQSGSEDEEGTEVTEPPASESVVSHRIHRSGPPIITEYARRGTRITSEKIQVQPISELLASIDLSDFGADDSAPVVLRSEEARFKIFLRALQSDFPAVHQLPKENVLPVVALRWVVQTLHHRWKETESKERAKERWSQNEAGCFLASFSWSEQDAAIDPLPDTFPPIDDRNIQLTAQVLAALDVIEHFVHALLLTNCIGSPARNFSGRRFHALLGGLSTTVPSPPPHLWEAFDVEMSEAFRQEYDKKVKKVKKVPSPAKKQTSKQRGNGLFSVLENI